MAEIELKPDERKISLIAFLICTHPATARTVNNRKRADLE